MGFTACRARTKQHGEPNHPHPGRGRRCPRSCRYAHTVAPALAPRVARSHCALLRHVLLFIWTSRGSHADTDACRSPVAWLQQRRRPGADRGKQYSRWRQLDGVRGLPELLRRRQRRRRRNGSLLPMHASHGRLRVHRRGDHVDGCRSLRRVLELRSCRRRQYGFCLWRRHLRRRLRVLRGGHCDSGSRRGRVLSES